MVTHWYLCTTYKQAPATPHIILNTAYPREITGVIRFGASLHLYSKDRLPGGCGLRSRDYVVPVIGLAAVIHIQALGVRVFPPGRLYTTQDSNPALSAYDLSGVLSNISLDSSIMLEHTCFLIIQTQRCIHRITICQSNTDKVMVINDINGCI